MAKVNIKIEGVAYQVESGMTILEATCCGTPSVVYQGTACEEVAAQHGGVAVPRGPEHLLQGIRIFT